MKHPSRIAIVVAAIIGFALSGRANVVVSDAWQDGSRTDPAQPTYSENGTDADHDGDIESAWYNANGTLTSSPGHLVGTLPANGTSSASWTTYFTPESSPVTLTSPGDTLKVTWVFTPSGVNSSSTSASGLRLAVVDSPSASRLTSDGSPGSSTYAGYGMFLNMAVTLGSSTPFQLMERSAPGTSSAFLSSSGSWTSLGNGATSGHTGYASGTQYTFVMTLTRNSTNGLDIVATMTGGSLNNTGSASVSFTDTTPSTFTYDTFGLRPSSANDSAASFDSTLFMVEFIPGATPPTISIDPQDRSVFVGQDASFSVLAAGTLPLSYEWRYNTNTVLTSATNSTLTVTNAQLSNAGVYSAIVSNAYGSVTSAVAQLIVSAPIAPSIVTQPQDQTVVPGATAMFTVTTSGSEPLSYQWYFNTSTLLTGATDSTLTLTNVQVANGGSYSVVVSNLAGSATSSNAVLTIDTSPVAPVFVTQPASQVVSIGGNASFTAIAAGTAPISYRWYKNAVVIPGATSSTLTLPDVQAADDGTYNATASNSVGVASSSNAVLTVSATPPLANSAFNLTGFGRFATGGGVLPDTDPNYAKVSTATDLANAINSKTAKIIEIMNDLNLGYNEIEASAKANSEPFRAHNDPQLHPVLLTRGVSLIDIQKKNGLTIFSANGATIRHATFNVKSCNNVIIRNLKFDEMWEWDEATKGDYDKNDWDFIDLGNSGTVSNVWVDHCTFTKAYDGIIDMKGGSANITLSWCEYTGDDGATNPNSFVWQQINKLESNRTSYAMYNALRTAGFSSTDIVTIVQGHDKTHLIGATTADENTNFTVTIHHQWFINPWDRLPRLRAGNVHDYNIYVDDTLALAAKNLRNQHSFSSSYNFNPPLNGSISTEGGAVLVEKSVYLDSYWPLRDNQTDISNTVYTGKIKALDTIYLNPHDNSLTRGNSTDPGSQLGPFQAVTHIPFSWNLPGNQLPYTYYMDDPAQLQQIVAAGAGAGVLTWNKTNWLVTSYAPTAPFIVADPHSQTVMLSNSVTFAVVASGSQPLVYQWYFNTISAVAGATNSTFSIASVQATNAGTYSVVVSNSAGSATSALATLGIATQTTRFQDWQMQYFSSTDCSLCGGDADFDGDGMSNTNEFLTGSNPTNSASGLRITSVMPQGSNMVITWNTDGGSTNVVQAASGDVSGSYATNFTDVSGPLAIQGSGDTATNYVDVGGATNIPSRYYRIRLGP